MSGSGREELAGTVAIGLIGAGCWGQNYLRVLKRLPQAKLKWCCDSDSSLLPALAALYPSTRFCNKPEAMLNDSEVKGIVIATPPQSHYQLGLQCLNAGKHVLIEKPFTCSSRELYRLWAAAERENCILMAGHIMEYHPAVQWIGQQLLYGRLGQVYYLCFSRGNLGAVRQDVNVLWDLAVHDLSMVRYLLNREPLQVSAAGASYLQPDIQDVVFITIMFGDGVIAHIRAGWLEANKTRKVVIVGEEKTIIFDDLAPRDKLRLYNRGMAAAAESADCGTSCRFVPTYGEIVLPAIDDAEPLSVQCRHFLECILRRQVPLTGKEDTLWVTKVAECAQQSMNNGGVPVSWARRE